MSDAKGMTSDELFYVLLQVMLLGFKWSGILDISYWWVLAPTWGQVCLLFLKGIVIGIIGGIQEIRQKSGK